MKRFKPPPTNAPTPDPIFAMVRELSAQNVRFAQLWQRLNSLEDLRMMKKSYDEAALATFQAEHERLLTASRKLEDRLLRTKPRSTAGLIAKLAHYVTINCEGCDVDSSVWRALRRQMNGNAGVPTWLKEGDKFEPGEFA